MLCQSMRQPLLQIQRDVTRSCFDPNRAASARPAAPQRRLVSVRAAAGKEGAQVAQKDKKDLSNDIVFKPFDEVHL